MFGRPKQTTHDWARELRRVVEIGADHVSLYELTVKRGTPLHKAIKRGETRLPPNRHEFYEAAVAALEEAGYRQYEVSNFSLPGRECRHNQRYWACEDFIGVGPGERGKHIRGEKPG